MPRIPGQIDVAKTEAILDAAVEVIGERGLSAPMEEIARRAGVSKQTVYNHYGSKAELVRALMARRVAQITAPLREPSAVDHPREALAAYARSMLETVITDQELFDHAGDHPGRRRDARCRPRGVRGGPRHARRQLAAFLEMETRLGRLKVENFDQAAEFFSGMVMGHSQLRSLLRLPSDKSQEEFDSLAREAAERFLRAYAPHRPVQAFRLPPRPACPSCGSRRRRGRLRPWSSDPGPKPAIAPRPRRLPSRCLPSWR
jgi:TetR/AcrR family transcriptional repressor of mexJK operon